MKLKLAALAAAAIVCGWGFTATAGDFAVDTKIQVDGKVLPGRTTTLFSGQRVYDLPSSPDQHVTKLDLVTGTFTVLEPTSHVQTQLSRADLVRYTAEILVIAQSAESPALLKGLASPNFEVEWDADQLKLNLRGSTLTYKVTLATTNETDAAVRYREFADAFARFNSIQRRGLPAVGRLQLNQFVAEKGMLPVAVERTLQIDSKPITSLHKYRWGLAEEDRQRIVEVERWEERFKSVGWTEFQRITQESATLSQR